MLWSDQVLAQLKTTIGHATNNAFKRQQYLIDNTRSSSHSSFRPCPTLGTCLMKCQNH
jgi:hypothetical protein